MPRQRSILATLIVLMTLVMSLLFAGFAAFHLSIAARAEKRDHEQFISTMLRFIHVELEDENGSGESEAEGLREIRNVVLRDAAPERFGTMTIAIVDEQGNLLLNSEGAEDLIKQNPPFPPLADSPDEAATIYWKSPTEHHFVLSSLRTHAPDGRVRHVRLALDRTVAESELAAFRRRSIIAVLICMVLTGLAVGLITRHALRPLTVIREAAERIRSGSFDVHLEPERLPAELIELGHSFERMQEHLRESFERLSQFAAELAHELRTPVNNLMGQTEVVLSKSRSSVEYEEILSSNLEEMARLSRMIDSLLFLAHASRGSAPVRAETLDLAIEADQVIEYHRLAADDLGVDLLREGSGTIRADRTLFRRALSNLLSNAIDASRPRDRVRVTIEASEDDVVVAVIDEGVGIDRSDLEQVFERFHRSRAARRRRPEGSGLGLAIVRSIMELHGGSVSIESEPGQGTKALLRFPADGAVIRDTP